MKNFGKLRISSNAYIIGFKETPDGSHIVPKVGDMYSFINIPAHVPVWLGGQPDGIPGPWSSCDVCGMAIKINDMIVDDAHNFAEYHWEVISLGEYGNKGFEEIIEDLLPKVVRIANNMLKTEPDIVIDLGSDLRVVINKVTSTLGQWSKEKNNWEHPNTIDIFPDGNWLFSVDNPACTNGKCAFV